MQVSISLDVKSVVELDKRVEEGGWSSRSSLVQHLLAQGSEHGCESCEAMSILSKSPRFSLPYGHNFPISIDEAKLIVDQLSSYGNSTTRSRERVILEIVREVTIASDQGFAELAKVLNDLTSAGMDKSDAEDRIERMVVEGKLLRPRGYDSLMVA